VFHAANFALFLAALALLFDLLASLLPRPGAFAGTLYFALLPLQRVNLTWISCSQDLLALLLSSRRSPSTARAGAPALVTALGAMASNERAPRQPRGRSGARSPSRPWRPAP